MATAQIDAKAAPGLGKAPVIQQISHAASRTDKIEKMVWFYEEFLGLPMTVTLTATVDPVTKEDSNYVHVFFELADGSNIAFFQFAAGLHGDMVPHSSDPFERHMALRVENYEDIARFQARADDFGIEHFLVDHHDFYSFYVFDPEGEQVEISWHKPSLAKIINPTEAKRLLNKWLDETGSRKEKADA